MSNLADKFRHVKCLVMPKMTRAYRLGVSCPAVRVTTLDRALRRRWEYDAHAALYAPRSGPIAHRLRKHHIPDWERLHGPPSWNSIMVDLDRHDLDNEADIAEWWAGQLDLCATALDMPFPDWYRTRGGGRLLWRFTTPIDDAHTFERTVAGVIHQCIRAGLDADEACADCTRLFRLTHSTRTPSEGPEDRAFHFAGATWEPEELPLLSGTKLSSRLGGRRADRSNRNTLTNRCDESSRPVGQSCPDTSVTSLTGMPALLADIGCEVVSSGDPDRLNCRCPWDKLHSDPLGGLGELNSSTALLRCGGGWAFSCLHNHTRGPIHERGPRSTYDLKRYYRRQWDAHITSDRQETSTPPPAAPAEPHIPTNLTATRQGLGDGLTEALASPGPPQFHTAPIGAGKTFQACAAIAEHAETCLNLGIKQHIGLACPTRKTRDEAVKTLGKALRELGISVPINRRTGRDPEYCRAHLEYHALREKAGKEAARDFCKTCPYHDGCPALRRMRNAGANAYKDVRVTVLTHEAFLCSDSEQIDPFDALIVDEQPNLQPTHQLTMEQLAIAAGLGHVKGASELLRLMDISMGENVHGIIGEELDDAVEALDIDLEALEDYARRTLKISHFSRICDDANRLAPLQVWLRLRDHCGTVNLRSGALAADSGRDRRFDAAALIYLDATPTDASKRVAEKHVDYGSGLDAAVDLHLVWVPLNASKRNQWRNPLPMATVHQHYDSPTTLHFDHKGIIEQSDILGELDWTKDCQGHIDYHKSATSRGSNEHIDCTTVVINDFFIPKVAQQALAKRYGCAESARYESQDAQIYQEIGRIRPHAGTRTVVWVGTRLPADLPKVAKSITQVDWRELHYQRTGEALGAPGLAAQLKDTASKDGVAFMWPGSAVYERSYGYFRDGPIGLAAAAGLRTISAPFLVSKTSDDALRRRVAHIAVGPEMDIGTALQEVVRSFITGANQPEQYRLLLDGKPLAEGQWFQNEEVCRTARAMRYLQTSGAPITTQNIADVRGCSVRTVQRTVKKLNLLLESAMPSSPATEQAQPSASPPEDCPSTMPALWLISPRGPP